MEQDIFESKFYEIKGRLKQHFGKLTDEEIAQIRGKKDVLLSKLQAKYGYSKEKALEELSKFMKQAGVEARASSNAPHGHAPHGDVRQNEGNRREGREFSSQGKSNKPRENR